MKRDEQPSEWSRVNMGAREVEGRSKCPEMGICSKCTYFLYQETQYGTKSYNCQYDSKMGGLHPEDPLVDCSNFYPKGQMTLAQMFSIATPIESGIKRAAGFVTEDDYECDLLLDELTD